MTAAGDDLGAAIARPGGEEEFGVRIFCGLLHPIRGGIAHRGVPFRFNTPYGYG